MLQTSDLEYELDSNISVMYQAVAKLSCAYETLVEGLPVAGRSDLLIDFTQAVKFEGDYRDLPLSIANNPINIITTGEEPIFYKQNTVYYNNGKNLIEGLFWRKEGILFSSNVVALYNAITQFVELAAIEQVPDYIIGTVVPDKPDTEDIECKWHYRAERNIDYITEKYDVTDFNRATVMNNQRDGSVELSRVIENSSAFADRIGNEIKNVTQAMDIADKWSIGDYVIISDEYWIITNIKYVEDKTYIKCIANFTKNFSNINRETGITREPSPFVYTGQGVQSNFIVREYLVMYKDTTTKEAASYFKALAQRVAMNLFDYSNTYNTPITNCNFSKLGSVSYIDMPVYSGGGGNVMLWHMAFNDARVGGYGLQKIGSAWYRNPVYYTDDAFEIESGSIRLSNEINLLTDTDDNKWYPKVDLAPLDLFTERLLPFDKDTNDTLAITYELIPIAEQQDIIIPSGFSKYSNLVRYYDTTPTIKIYSDTEPFTIFDKKVRGAEISGTVTLTDSTITILDSLGDPIPYWCIGYGDEIILAGNNSLSVIKYLFTTNRYEYVIDINIDYEIDVFIQIGIEIETTKQEFYDDVASAVIPLSFTAEFEKLEFIVYAAQVTVDIPIALDVSVLMTEFDVNAIQVTVDINTLAIAITGQKKYLITYHEDGADVNNNPRTFIFEDLPISLNDPLKVGNSFNGWYDNSGFTGSPITVISTIGSKELWAEWI